MYAFNKFCLLMSVAVISIQRNFVCSFPYHIVYMKTLEYMPKLLLRLTCILKDRVTGSYKFYSLETENIRRMAAKILRFTKLLSLSLFLVSFIFSMSTLISPSFSIEGPSLQIEKFLIGYTFTICVFPILISPKYHPKLPPHSPLAQTCPVSLKILYTNNSHHHCWLKAWSSATSLPSGFDIWQLIPKYFPLKLLLYSLNTDSPQFPLRPTTLTSPHSLQTMDVCA